MIYITQLIFVREGKEEIFHEFENIAIPLIAKYNGQLLYRIRPGQDSCISCDGERPYEVHLVSFDSEKDFENFMKDGSRLKFIHLKEESVKAMMLVKGTAFGK